MHVFDASMTDGAHLDKTCFCISSLFKTDKEIIIINLHGICRPNIISRRAEARDLYF